MFIGNSNIFEKIFNQFICILLSMINNIKTNINKLESKIYKLRNTDKTFEQ